MSAEIVFFSSISLFSCQLWFWLLGSVWPLRKLEGWEIESLNLRIFFCQDLVWNTESDMYWISEFEWICPIRVLDLHIFWLICDIRVWIHWYMLGFCAFVCWDCFLYVLFFCFVDVSVFACSALFGCRESLGKREIGYLNIGLFFVWNLRYQKLPQDWCHCLAQLGPLTFPCLYQSHRVPYLYDAFSLSKRYNGVMVNGTNKNGHS